MKKALTIGAVAARTGVSTDTIRFYERKGLLPRPPRNGSGYRVYTSEIIARIGFLKKARELGFSLVEIEALQTIERDGPPSTRCNIKECLRYRLQQIEREIDQLGETHERLQSLYAACKSQLPCPRCQVLQHIHH